MGLLRYIIGFVLVAMSLLMTSCSDSGSLQKYLVDKQDDDKFMKVDMATSMLQTEESSFTQDQKDILNTVKKVNVVAYKLTDGNVAEYEAEKQKLADIISGEKYQTLIKMGSNNKGATLKYLGDEDAIDEVIIFGSDDEKGFAVFRLLGDDMRPDQMIKLMTSIEKGDLDVSKLSGIGELFEL